MSDADRKMLEDLFQLLNTQNNDGFMLLDDLYGSELYGQYKSMTGRTMHDPHVSNDVKVSKQEWLQAWGAAWNETVKESIKKTLKEVRDTKWKRRFGMSPTQATLMLGVAGIVAALALAKYVKARA